MIRDILNEHEPIPEAKLAKIVEHAERYEQILIDIRKAIFEENKKEIGECLEKINNLL